MVRDRLPELQRSISSSSSSANGAATSIVGSGTGATSIDLNMHEMQNAPVDEILNPYAEIRVNLAQIAANLESMNRMVQTINIRNFNENEMDELRCANLKIGNQLMNKFRDFKANLPAENDYSLEARMKRTLFYGLYQSYINIWTKNEEFLQNYENKLKKNLHMHTKISEVPPIFFPYYITLLNNLKINVFEFFVVNCNATEEEIEELIANKTTNLFVGNILEETEKERRTLRDLMDRFNELKKLEKSIEDVHALFLRIQTLVLEQSETIQRVEFHAQQATLYVDKGADQLDKADKLHKKAVKKKMIIIAILIVVAIILLFIVVVF